MLVFWNERLILLAVPKTGTTALEEALLPRAALALRDPPALKHATPQRVRRHVLPLLRAGGAAEGWEMAAVIREPVSWLSSWFRYRRRDAIAGQANSTRHVTFDGFAEEWLAERPASWAQVGAQHRYAFGADGEPEARLFPYEEPARLHAFLESRLRTRIALPRLNVSPAMDTPLSPSLLDRLRRERPEEFRAWEAARA